MDPPQDPTSGPWGHQLPSRPPSNVSYNPYVPSNSSSPARGNPYNPQYQPPHGAAFNQMNERQRVVYELTYQNRQNVASRPPMNGGGPRPYSGHRAPHPFQHLYHNIPHLPLPDNLSEQQRYVRDLIVKLEGDKKLLVESRKATTAELKRLQKEVDGFESKQRGQEYLRWIYPLQAEIGRIEGIHDGYGREWEHVEELLELCWAELAVPDI
ncbi:MAG: hypothetical protein Q9211_001354 [Gyalolechia sp. 1 TL-2023]